MTAKNKTNQRLISAFLIILMLAPAVLFSIPKQISAQEEVVPTGLPVKDVAVGFWTKLGQIFGFSSSVSNKVSAVQNTTTAGMTTKQVATEAFKELRRVLARRLLAQMTQSTVNWINSGFHGAPLFLERPGSFFKDIAKSEIRDLVSIVGYNSTSYPFGKSTAINTINGYKQTFAQNAQYSLSKVVNDPILLNNIRNDFSVGGWDGFMINTQFPQNNYIGFQMIYANELARRIQGTSPNQADLTSAALAQGGGFLSPQTCPSNPAYNNLKNQFQQPSFKCSLQSGINKCDSIKNPEEQTACYDQYYGTVDQCAKEEAEWAKTNSCPGGLVNTTPGSVVAGQIIKAVTGPFSQTELGAAMGNSLSAIFDALLNKFISSGLNSLSGTNNNSNNNNDNFDYYGNTLGSPSTGTTSGGFDFGGPDEEVVLSTFKQNVQNAIDKGNQELKSIDNADINNPGLYQVFAKIWPKTEELDMCLPGPNLGWQDRMETESQKNSEGLQIKMNDGNPEKINAATSAYNGLLFATSSFKEWISKKMNNELPSSASYVHAVDSIKTIQSQALDLAARKNVILNTLIKLESIRTDLSAISTQPARGSGQETEMVRLKQRFDGILLDLSTTTTVSGIQNDLADAKDKLNNLDTLINKCQVERQNKGWTLAGGEASTFNSKTEKELFCSLPIEGGYSHPPFTNNGTVTYPEIPLVNADNVYPDSSGVSDSDHIDIKLSCDIIYKAYVTDYKKNLPS